MVRTSIYLSMISATSASTTGRTIMGPPFALMVAIALAPTLVGFIGVVENCRGRYIGHRAGAVPAFLAVFGGVYGLGFGRPAVEQFKAGFAERIVKCGGNLQPDFIRAVAADDFECGFD